MTDVICKAFAISLLLVSTAGLQAQTTFDPPTRSPDYESYLYFEDCLGAVGRIRGVERMTSKVVDTTRRERKKRYHDPLSQAVKDTGRICSTRWPVDSVEMKHIKWWGEDLMALGRIDDVKIIYKRYIASLSLASKAEERLNARAGVRDLYGRYLDDELLSDYLTYWKEYHDDIPSDSLPLKLTSLLSKIVMWVQLWEPDRAASELDEYIKYLYEIPLERRTSPLISYMAYRFFPTAKLLRESEIMEKLSVSTSAYSEYLKDLWKQIGGSNELVLPLDSIAPQLIGKWLYTAQKDANDNLFASLLPDSKIDFPRKGKINLIAFIEGGCHEDAYKTTPGTFQRLVAIVDAEGRSASCNSTIEAINRIKEKYPEIELTIVSRTFGLFGTVLPESPEKEAETLAKYFIEHYNVNGNVLVAETEYFRLPGLDQRRIDYPDENEENYKIANIPNGGYLKVVLVDPDGKIFFADLIMRDEENVASNLTGAVLKRSNSNTAQQ